MAKMKGKKPQHTDSTEHWGGCRTTGPFIHCWEEWKPAQPLWKTIWLPSPKPKRVSNLRPNSSILKHLLENNKNVRFQKDTCKNVHGSFIQNNPNLESTYMGIQGRKNKQLWYNHLMEYYSAMKRNTLRLSMIIGMNLR